MRLEVFRSLWGLVGEGCRFRMEETFAALAHVRGAAVGYRGIEYVAMMVPDRAAFGEALARHELESIPMVITFGGSVDEHLSSYRMQLEWAREIPHRLVISHSGSDAFDEDDARRFFDEALRIERDLGVTVAHETHRGRILFHPWITKRMVDRFEDLKLNCDLSHWVVVAERLIEDQTDLIAHCAERTIHVHARVGHEHGPQVADPRAPEFRPHLEAHERWWSTIWDAQERRGMEVSTLTPEFGPPPYQPVLPYTKMPTADLETICDWMAERQKTRFAERRRST